MINSHSLYVCIKFSTRKRFHVYCSLLNDNLFHTWRLSSRADIHHYNVTSLYHISRGLHKSCCSSVSNSFRRVPLGSLNGNVNLFLSHILNNYRRLILKVQTKLFIVTNRKDSFNQIKMVSETRYNSKFRITKCILSANNHQAQPTLKRVNMCLTLSASGTNVSMFAPKTSSLHDVTVPILTVLRTLQRTVLSVVARGWTS